eukprot:CAMPEP_0178448154 /NCGR_PEP_ID=MMETSP0689_2-20121128/41817_1 /TAXON_ID=160604 /ORGANISM="Amphidinium massartii, Strain CS-259" /LENGTH=77 /DNA_ID=CAMNT_0020073289 /DNA_START=312 /DNA_END=541 /DNA_ORIENTATION=+
MRQRSPAMPPTLLHNLELLSFDEWEMTTSPRRTGLNRSDRRSMRTTSPMVRIVGTMDAPAVVEKSNKYSCSMCKVPT